MRGGGVIGENLRQSGYTVPSLLSALANGQHEPCDILAVSATQFVVSNYGVVYANLMAIEHLLLIPYFPIHVMSMIINIQQHSSQYYMLVLYRLLV